MNSPEPDEFVSRVLSDWRVEPLRDPQFRASVSRRIDRLRRPAWTDYARTHAALLAGALALALAVGGWAGRARAQARVAADRAEIASAYVQALDARVMATP